MKTDKTYLFTEEQLRDFIQRVLGHDDSLWLEEVALEYAQEVDIDFFYAESMGDKDDYSFIPI